MQVRIQGRDGAGLDLDSGPDGGSGGESRRLQDACWRQGGRGVLGVQTVGKEGKGTQVKTKTTTPHPLSGPHTTAGVLCTPVHSFTGLYSSGLH